MSASLTTVRVLVADDHPVVREGLIMILGSDRKLRIVGAAADGVEACQMFINLRPDVLLLDLRMPRMDGLEVVRELFTSRAGARILMMTTFSGDDRILLCLERGALGYLLKDAPREEIIHAVHRVAQGKPYAPPDAASTFLRRLSLPRLTKRELMVLKQVALGYPNKKIAGELRITEGTVKTHLKSILGKLGASSRTEALVLACKAGYLNL